jgi:hypothetical protein
MPGFMGPSKLSSPVTTLSNRTSLLHGGLLEGEWGSPGWRPGQTITGSQDFISGGEAQFWLSRDFIDGYHTWDPEGHAYNMLIRFFPCWVYTDSNHRDTLEYEWPLVRCCHLIVCLVYYWWLDDEDGYGCFILMITALLYFWCWLLSMFCLFMHVIVYRCKHNTWLN